MKATGQNIINTILLGIVFAISSAVIASSARTKRLEARIDSLESRVETIELKVMSLELDSSLLETADSIIARGTDANTINIHALKARCDILGSGLGVKFGELPR